MPEELTIPQLKKEIIARGGRPLTGLKRNLVNQLRFLLNEQCPQVAGSDEETKTESETSTSEESKKPLPTSSQSLVDAVPDVTQASEVKVVSFSPEIVVNSESSVSKLPEKVSEEQVKMEVKEIVKMEVEKVGEKMEEKGEKVEEKVEERKKSSKKRKRALASLGTCPSTSIPKRKTKKRKTKEEVKESDKKIEIEVKNIENVVDSCKMNEVKSVEITANDLLMDHSSKDDTVKDIQVISEEEKADEIEIEVIVEEDELRKDNKQVQEQLGILFQKWDDLQAKITHIHQEQNELKEMIDKIAMQINN
uniref:SAP domain-containing protein n=1 Tax=Arcella intermedia TaxID=1963864 RepID=A0A6B2LAL2_9EUKA